MATNADLPAVLSIAHTPGARRVRRCSALSTFTQYASGKWRQLARDARVAVLAAVRPRENESDAR
jgi:copper homeostasis protein CutC